ncbi:hypothetical protein ACFST9_23920 [Hymenobacter monticola]
MLLPVALLCCLTGTAMGQAPASFPLDKVTRRISYAAVVPAVGVSQADLQARARAWASGLAPAGKPPVETSEQDTEVLTAYGAQPFAYTYDMTQTIGGHPRHHAVKQVLHYTVKLSLREGRYRYELTDFIIEYPKAKPSASRLPAEVDLISARPITEDGGREQAAERKTFAEAAAKLQAQLKEMMNTPIGTPEAKQ